MHPQFLPARTSPVFFGAVAIIAAGLCALSLGAAMRESHAAASAPPAIRTIDEHALASVRVSAVGESEPRGEWRVSAMSNRFEPLHGGAAFIANGVVEILAQSESSATLAVAGRAVRISHVEVRGNDIALQFHAGEHSAPEHLVMHMNDRRAWNAKPVRIATKIVAALVAANESL